MNIVILEDIPGKALEYTKCHISCWQSAYKGIIPDSYLKNMANETEERAERLRNNLTALAGEYLFYYAEIDDKMAGRLIFGKCRDEDKPDAGEIQAVYLLEEYWGKGLSRQLMDFAVNQLRNMGYREIVLWVLEENKRARRFYEKHGFLPDGEKKEICIDGKSLTELRYKLITQNEV